LSQCTSDKLPRMGSLLERRTPVQLLWIIGALSALVSLGFGMLTSHPSKKLPLILLGWAFAAIVVGMIGSLFAEQSLRDGVTSEQWSDSLLARPRKFITHLAAYILECLLFIGFVVYVVSSNFHNFGGGWMFLWPMLTIIRVQACLRPKKPTNLLRPIEPPKPLQSENWGTSSRPFSF
jgi:hypothetical protein